jgi:hypothetical protein
MAYTKKPLSAEEAAKAQKERAAKMADARAKLDAGLSAIRTSEDWVATLTRMAVRRKYGVGRYSFGNQILLDVQRQGVRQAATFKAWQNVGRNVTKGSKGLMIYQPIPIVGKPAKGETEGKRGIIFRPLYVFALEQTEGEAFPEGLQPTPDLTIPEAFDGALKTLADVARALPEVSDVEIRERKRGEHPNAMGWFSRLTKSIIVIDTPGNPGGMFATLAHEVAHALLHGSLTDHHERDTCEVEAESTAFIVCHVLGVDTSAMSFPYVSGWVGEKDPLKTLEKTGDRIVRASNRILDALLGKVDAIEADDAAPVEALAQAAE